MKILGLLPRAAMNALLCLIALAAAAADYPAPNEGDWIARDFRFHTGDVMPELRLHYTTVGAPSGQPVLILHGTTGSRTTMLSPAFAGELFGPGQPLDASKYFVILPDAIGTADWGDIILPVSEGPALRSSFAYRLVFVSRFRMYIRIIT